MLGPEHVLGARVKQLFYLRYDGPDACPQGYEEADGEEYASTAAAVGQQLLCHSPQYDACTCNADGVRSDFSTCITGAALEELCMHSARHTGGCSRAVTAGHSGLTRQMALGSSMPEH